MGGRERLQALQRRGREFWERSITPCVWGSTDYVTGFTPEYLAWKTEVTSVLKQLFGSDHPIYEQLRMFDAVKVVGNDKDGTLFDEAHAHVLGALIAAQAEIDQGSLLLPGVQPYTEDPISTVRRICERFHQVAVTMRLRHGRRQTLNVGDEYDVQDLLRSLLRLHFDDIRPEEWVPSYAGSSSRVDFLLKGTGIVVEVKKTRKGLGDRELGDQLIMDVARYKSHPECKHLVCLIYDPDERVVNAAGLTSDLQKASDHRINVEVIMSPKRS